VLLESKTKIFIGGFFMRQSRQFINVFTTLFFIAVLFISPATATAAITVYTTDVIPNASRTNYVGFEAMSGGDGLSPLWEEDGVRVEQINGDGNDIYTIYNWGQEGSRSWYPSGGDNGYTRITLISGGDFSAVGMLVGTGWSLMTFYVQYALLSDNVIVAQGELTFTSGYPQYLGFSGGGFDEIRLTGTDTGGYTSVTDGHYQALSLDAIEIAATINEPPATPVLTDPASGTAVSGTSVTLQWEKSTDPEGGAVTYILQIAENSGFTSNLQQFNVDENGTLLDAMIFPFFALTGWGLIKRRKQTLMLMMAVLLLTSVMITGCGSGGWGDDTNTNSVSYNVPGLNSGTTYYWRVIAVDADGIRSVPSETRTFTTN
jgi:hypothetical protein